MGLKLADNVEVKNEKGRFTHLAGASILLADDVWESRQIIGRFLRNAGAEVDEAEDGIEALDRLKSQSYDVVLIDIKMPRKDGFEVIHNLRKNNYNAPALAITAMSGEECGENLIKAGFDDYIRKPVTAEAIVDFVARYCLRH